MQGESYSQIDVACQIPRITELSRERFLLTDLQMG